MALKMTSNVAPHEGSTGPQFRFAGEVIASLVQQAHEVLQDRYGPARLAGRNRLVFESRGVVIKLPLNDYGMHDNEREARKYRERRYFHPMAPCRLAKLFDIPLVVMQKVDTKVPYQDLPEWAAQVDCGQVGRDRRGALVAYDYA